MYDCRSLLILDLTIYLEIIFDQFRKGRRANLGAEGINRQTMAMSSPQQRLGKKNQFTIQYFKEKRSFVTM